VSGPRLRRSPAPPGDSQRSQDVDTAGVDQIRGNVRLVRPGQSLEVGDVSHSDGSRISLVESRLAKHPEEKERVGYVIELNGET
jgi:hypothetical protein